MRVAALSDFHIGARGHADGFQHDPSSFARFLDDLERDHDTIVLLGDIWQTDHATVPTRHAAARHLRAARRRLGRLAQRLSEPPYVYVHGNHDEIALDELGAPEQVVLDRVLFIHGHQFDPVANVAPWAATAGTWTTGQLRKVGLRPLASWFEGRDVTIKDQRFRGVDGPYARAADSLATAHAADVIVMGHTHVPSRHVLPSGVTAVNTGTCSGGHRMFVSIDTATRTVHVFDGKRPL
ncbi:MAG: metallophosphoesterase family protein [Myxococcota bacterium]